MVSGTEVIWFSGLPESTSAQRAKLIALTKALELAKGKRVTTERPANLSKQRKIKSKEEIPGLLAAAMLPRTD